MDIIGFLYNWQELVGNLAGAFIAVFLSFIITILLGNRREKKERQAHYSTILLVLYDLQHFISKCEEYVKQANDGKKLFDRISLNDKLVYIGASHLLYLEIDFYKDAQDIYGEANVIKSKMDKDEYKEAISLMKYYLPSFYHKFNVIAKEIKKLQNYYGHLKFPKNITFYEKVYVEKKTKELNLERYPTGSQN